MAYQRILQPGPPGSGGSSSPAPVSSTAWAAANAAANAIGLMMEDRFLDDVEYDHGRYVAAMRRAASTAQQLRQRVGEAIGSSRLQMPAADAQQIVLGSLMQAKKMVAALRVLAYSDSSQARALERRAAQVLPQHLQATNRFLQQAKRAASSSSGTSGIGFLMAAALVALGVYLIVDLATTTETVGELNEALRTCIEAGCTPAERQVIIDEWKRRREALDQQEKESGCGPFEFLCGAAGDVIRWVALGGAVLVGGYLLWVTWPALAGGGRAIRAKLKR